MLPASPLTARRGRNWLLLGFGLSYALVSLVNHLMFRTAALDLGYVAQAVADLAHGHSPRVTLLPDAPPTGFLGQHFSLTPGLAVPLYYLVGGPWALLLVQLAAVLLGGLGVWRYVQALGGSGRAANWALALFCSQWGLYSALGYDYHDNVVGAMALPWLARWVAQRRAGPAVAAAVFMLVSKENMALWLAFVLLGLAWQHRAHRATVGWLLVGAVGALGYFQVVTRYVMPALDTTHRPFTQAVRYAHLGPSLPAAVLAVLLHPRLLWASLFENILPNPDYDYIKLELWAAVGLSGGWALVRRPWYALMLAPILGQKLLSNDYGLWGINAQYSVEFAPVLALAVADALRPAPRTGEGPPRRAWRWALAGAAGFTLLTLFVRRSEWYDRASVNFLQASHYRSALPDPAAVRAALAQVPPGTALSTTAHLVPHLLDRRDIFHFPVLRTARLVLLPRTATDYEKWPLTLPQAQAALPALLADTAHYRVQYQNAALVLLARRFAPADSAQVWRPAGR